jgi:CRISPR-associated protein Cmr5
MQSRKQRLAKAIWGKFEHQTDKKYGTWAHKLPVLIRSAGLAQALAFVVSKTKENTPERTMLNDFANVVSSPHQTLEAFTSHVRTANLQEYMRLTRLSLEVCVWFKRFTESKLNVSSTSEDTDDAA